MALIFEDRVATYPNRYKVTPTNGDSAYHVVLERADNPTIVGTPLNAETFNGILDEIANILPAVTDADDGKLLLVSEGEWATGSIKIPFSKPTLNGEGTLRGGSGYYHIVMRVQYNGEWYICDFGLIYFDMEFGRPVYLPKISFTNEYSATIDASVYITVDDPLDEYDDTHGTLHMTVGATGEGVLPVGAVEFYTAKIDDFKIQSATSETTELINNAHRVGDVHISTDSTSPASLFGGTWERLKDRFILAAGDTYAAGSTGGAATHKLTVNEMPSHGHEALHLARPISDGGTAWGSLEGSTTIGATVYWAGIETLSTGGNQAHNNMPPYTAFYVWVRIA